MARMNDSSMMYGDNSVRWVIFWAADSQADKNHWEASPTMFPRQPGKFDSPVDGSAYFLVQIEIERHTCRLTLYYPPASFVRRKRMSPAGEPEQWVYIVATLAVCLLYPHTIHFAPRSMLEGVNTHLIPGI